MYNQGMQQQGMGMQPGMQQQGMYQPGMQQQGMGMQPGMQQQGLYQPGMQQQQGMMMQQQQPGMPPQGMMMQQPGTVAVHSQGPVTVVHGGLGLAAANGGGTATSAFKMPGQCAGGGTHAYVTGGPTTLAWVICLFTGCFCSLCMCTKQTCTKCGMSFDEGGQCM